MTADQSVKWAAPLGAAASAQLHPVWQAIRELVTFGRFPMAEYMESLNEIAPVLRLTTVSNEGLVGAIWANAKTSGAIFGATERVDALS